MLSSSRIRMAIMAVAAVMVAACGSSSGGFTGDVASLRVLHAVADAPRVNIYLNEEEVLSEVDFRTGSPFLPVTAGTYDIRVEAIVPGGNVDVITANGVELAADTATTIAAVGNVGAGTIAPLPVAEPTEEIAAGNFRLQVTHASPEAPPVYIALTTPDFPIEQADFVGPLSYTETFGPGEFAADSYQVRVIASDPAAGVSDADVLFDSGTLPLGEGADLHVFAVTSTVPSTAVAPSPISLVVLDGTATPVDVGSFDVFDVNTGAYVTIVHDAVGVGAVDVFADVVETTEIEEIQLADDLAYSEVEPRQAVPALEFDVGVRLAGQSSAAFGFNADLMAGMGYTAIARIAADTPDPTAQILVDDYRPVATAAKVRLVHGAKAAGVVDVYVFASGANSTPGNGEPLLLLEGFEYGDETGFLSLPAGSYDIYVTLGGTTTVAIPVPGLEVAAGSVYTAIAREPLEGQSAFGVILIAD